METRHTHALAGTGGGLFWSRVMSRQKNQSNKGHGVSKGKEREPRTLIRFKTALMNTLMDVLRHRPGWVEVKDEGEWDFYWCDVSWLRENFDHTYMDEHVRISHFRNHYELTRKNYMVKNLKRFRKQLEREAGKVEAAKCDFFPKTFEMPCEYHLFVEEFRKNPGITWIMKPVARSQGKGIFLFRRLKDIMDWRKGTVGKKLTIVEAQPARTNVNPSASHDTKNSDDQKEEMPVENYVAQRYVENPYLIGGRKFDLRVYVLVMSYIPLRAWLYRDGFARFSNTRFTLSSIDDHYVHLTNVAVQKTSPDYHPKKGCKWMLQRFRQYLASKHGPEAVETLFSDMDNIFIKSLQSVQKLSSALPRWLLEVNASPSLTASSQEDYELKTCLLEDTLHVVDMEARLTGKEKRIGGFDLMWNDGPVSREEGPSDPSGMGNFVTNTHLGMPSQTESEWDRNIIGSAGRLGGSLA
ncbi:probable tubulin polyglutamylase TTLL9 isoform X4 [Peromyscus californicus insignis]|uniref:probable tubulin polyglutamylase TTLL9 isoform X4 n=1 Tax=Peromyscus californicus insignis TaxID=564181 RepID=UPI0022A7DA28|nr:probable tubulin polyglutamylase TTLL9 isoform X4 [Peromyscus californicus insignis]